MLFLLILIELAASQIQTGWHTSIHRVNLDQCNDLKSKIASSTFCGDDVNTLCTNKEGPAILGRDSEFKHQSIINPNVEMSGPWSDQLNKFDSDISERLPSQCDVLRLSAIVGEPWENSDDQTSPLTVTISGFQNKRYMISGITTITENVILVTSESLIDLYFIIDDTNVDLNIRVESNTNELPRFSPNKMGFHHFKQTERHSLVDDSVTIGSEPFFFAESLTHGMVQSVTGKCTNDIQAGTMLRQEMLTAGESGEYVASCSNGYRSPDFSMRKATSKMSAIAVCIVGDSVKVYSERLVDFATALRVCQIRGMNIPTFAQVRSLSFCDQIFPFGLFYYMWVTVDDLPPHVRVEIETVEDIPPHFPTHDDDVNQDSLNVDVNAWTVQSINGVQSTVSDVFPQLMNSDHRWGVVAEYRFPVECHVLETKVEYKPFGIDFETIEGVSRWIVSRRNGIWQRGFFMPSSAPREPIRSRSESLSHFFQTWERDAHNVRLFHQGDEVSSNAVKFESFSEHNHISGDTIQFPGNFPRTLNIIGDSRSDAAYITERAFLAVKTLSHCSISLLTTGRSQLELVGVNAAFGIDDYKVFDNVEAYKDYISSPDQWKVSPTVTFVPGRFYWLQAYSWFQKSDNPLDIFQSTLMWNCGNGFEVIPRTNFFSVGDKTQDQIISDKSHINVRRSAEFQVSLSRPPSTQIDVVCTGPSSVVISPSILSFDSTSWTEMKTVQVFSGLTYTNLQQNNPDTFIHCTSAGLNVHSISLTIEPNDPHHFLVSPSGYFANWFSEDQRWRVRDFQLELPDQEVECVQTLLDFQDNSFSFIIETKHNSLQTENIKISPLTGVAFAYGGYVYAVYTSVLSKANGNGWDVYRLSAEQTGGPKISRVPLDDKFNPGKLTVEFPCGSTCEVIPRGHHFMQLSCVVSSSFAQGWQPPTATPHCSPLVNSFFQYPSATTSNLIVDNAVPTWPAGSPYNNHVFPSVSAPASLQASAVIPLKMSSEEISTFMDWKSRLETGVNFFARGAWHDIRSKCPQMSDKVINALRPLLSTQVSLFVPEININEFITSILKLCQADFIMQKSLTCLGPWQFNEDDATQSLRSMIFYFTSMSRKVSDNIAMVGRGLVLLADNGMPGHLCSPGSHLVGSPPQCACIGSGVYPNCPDTINCPPATQEQLDLMASLAVVDYTQDILFCNAEKSIVIVRSLGVSINCYRGFCYYWSSPSVRNGLKYELCVTPYCVTGYLLADSGTVSWYGLTECGQTVVSVDNGDTWSVTTPFPVDAPQEQKATPVESSNVRVPLADPEYYDVSSSSIVRAGHSRGKMVIVSMNWWCECIDPDTWNTIF